MPEDGFAGGEFADEVHGLRGCYPGLGGEEGLVKGVG